jgi:hypothetical protein
MVLDVAAPALDADEALADVRWWWREQRPGPSIWRRLDVVYTVAISVAILGALAYGTASSALAQVVTPRAMAGFGPSVALLALLVTAQWGAFQGPVVYSVADVAHLLGAPLPRRGLAWRRLVRGLLTGAGAGAVVGALLLVGLAGQGRGVATERVVAFAAGLAELGMLGVAAAWAVQSSRRWERIASRAVWPAALAAAALAAASDRGDAGREVALWSGPWGWAVQAGAGVGTTEWVAALVLLTATTVLAAVATVRGCGRCPAERHMRRAEARAGAVASLMSFDARSARRAFETAGASDRANRGARLARVRAALAARGASPGARALATAWRDGVAARRAPGRALEAAVLTAAGTMLALLQADRPAAVLAAMLLVYAGAARMLWPLRAELDVTSRARVLLRPPLGRVLVAHTIVPAIVTAVAAAVAAAGCAVAGGLHDNGAVAAVLAVAATRVALCCAAMSARRGGRLPQSVFVGAVAMDPSGGAIGILGWLAWWPTLAAGLGAVPILLATSSGISAALVAAGCVGVVVAGLARMLGRDPDQA